MENELTMLNRKVQTMLTERRLPEEIKSMVESIFQEYRNLYESNMKEDGIKSSEQYAAYKNIDEYFEGNAIQSMHKINNEYKEKCMDKAEIVTIILSTFESERYTDTDYEIEKSEIDALNKTVINDRENYLYIERITNTVIDCIEDSKNQWFRVLEGLRTSNQKKEYIYGQIKLIENTAKLKLGSLKEYLEVDDRQILEQILKEYEKLTGYSVLVNTSFNVRGEPIVCTPKDAYTCFMRTDMDVLAMGHFLLYKNEQPIFGENTDWREQ